MARTSKPSPPPFPAANGHLEGSETASISPVLDCPCPLAPGLPEIVIQCAGGDHAHKHCAHRDVECWQLAALRRALQVRLCVLAYQSGPRRAHAATIAQRGARMHQALLAMACLPDWRITSSGSMPSGSMAKKQRSARLKKRQSAVNDLEGRAHTGGITIKVTLRVRVRRATRGSAVALSAPFPSGATA